MEFLLNFNSWFKALPASGKVSLVLVVVGVVIAGTLLRSHYTTAGYQYLYTNLTLTDANAVAERLQAMNVQAQVRGDAVLVPGDRVLELRNMLASEGLPRGGGVGFEIFDKRNFGETEFQQRINYIRAVQGELARTIGVIDGVEKSRVHIVVPEKSIFSEDQKEPSASVTLTLHKGRRLSDAQVGGIVHMMVTSVEGLTEANINVIDQTGNILFRGARDQSSGGGSKNLQIQADMDARYERGVREMLERIVGSGGVSVKVTTQLNLAQVEKMVEQVDPESRVALQENVTTETSSGSTGAPGGVPGATANLPGGNAAQTSQARSENSKKTESQSTFAVSRSTQKILEPVGTIQKLSVAVLVDGTYKKNEDGTTTYEPRSAEELKKFEDIVRRAVGFSQERGDEVRIENIQFQREVVDDKAQEEFVQATNATQWNLFLMDNGKLVAVVLIIGVLFLLMMRMINSYAPPIQVAYANIIGQQAGKIAQALPSDAQVSIIARDDPAARDRVDQLAKQLPDAQQRRDGPNGPTINFVESARREINIETPVTSEEKLRLQAAKMQTEQIFTSDLNEAVGVIRAWLNEG